MAFCIYTLVKPEAEPKARPFVAASNNDGLSYIPPADQPFTGEHHEPLQMVMDIAGVKNPTFIPASSSSLDGSDEVIGLVVEGKAFAFSRQAMLTPSRHIINFEVDDQPISVTYCDMVSQARVLTRAPGTGPIDLRVGGMDRYYQLVLMLDGTRYGQSVDTLPLEDYPFERMTLRQWREQYPDSLIYEG